MILAPIVLFVYNRPWHTQQTIEALQNNYLAKESELFIYSDQAKSEDATKSVDEVRTYISQVKGFKKVTIIKREKNFGLADSIIDGVTKVVNEFEKVIVLEDDLVTSPNFLKFMNEALELYKEKQDVWHISGWNYPTDINISEDAFFWRAMSCWGWATWSVKWKYFEKDSKKLLSSFMKEDIKKFNIDGYQDFWVQVEENYNAQKNTWAVFWYASIFKQNGLCLNPTISLVSNIGVDGSGSNCSDKDLYQVELNSKEEFKFPSSLYENKLAVVKIQDFNKSISSKNIFTRGQLLIKNLYSIFFKYYVNNLMEFRRLLKLRIKFPDCYIAGKTHIVYENINYIQLNKNTYIGNFTTIHITNFSKEYKNSYFELGENSVVGELNNIRASGGKIIIGKNCLISQNVSMVAANHNIAKGSLIMEQEWDAKSNNIIINDDVWVGANSVVLPGVRIKRGAIVAAGSVVTRDVEEYSIVAGTPAVHIRYRK